MNIDFNPSAQMLQGTRRRPVRQEDLAAGGGTG